MSEYDQLTGQVKTLEREVRRLRVGLDKIATPSGGVRVSAIDTSSLPDLTDYARLPGRTGGQLLKGGIGAGENLLLQSTAHATRGVVGIIDNAYAAGYLRVGSAVAPNNVTAGDLTVTRLLVGSNLALPTGQTFRNVGPMFVPDGGTDAAAYIGNSWAPAGAGGAAIGLQSSFTVRSTANDAAHESYAWALAITHDTGDYSMLSLNGVQASVMKQIAAGAAVLAHMKGFRSVVRPNAGVVTNVYGIELVMGAGADAGVVTTSYGVLVRNRVGYTVANQYGLYVEALSGAGTLNVGLYLGGAPTCAIDIHTDTAANGAITWGTARDTNLYRSAADTLKTDDSFHVGADFKHLGANIGFFNHAVAARPAAYTPSNVTPRRSFDADAVTLDELADVVGTLIADDQSLGFRG